MSLVDRVARRLEPSARREWLAAVAAASVDVDGLTRALEAGGVDEALAVLRDSLQLPPEAQAKIASVLEAAYRGVAKPVAVGLGIDFQLVNPHAVTWASENAGLLIQGIGPDGDMVRRLVAQAFTDGVPPRELARQLERFVGLTGGQSQQLSNFEAGRRAAGLKEDRVRALADQFRDRLLRRRATVIARTETISAATHGKLEAWREAARQGVIDVSVTAERWVTGGDDRVCELCGPLHNRLVGFGQEFVVTERATGFTGPETRPIPVGMVPLEEPIVVDAPPLHPQCRCDIELQVYHSTEELGEALAT